MRIFAYKRIGDLLGDAKPGNPRPSGVNQYTKPEAMSQGSDISTKDGSQRNRDWQARTVAEYWDIVEPILPEMKKPSINAVMHDIAQQVRRRLQEPPTLSTSGICCAAWSRCCRGAC